VFIPRQFDALTAYYLKKHYPDYNAEFREIAKKNTVTNWLLDRPSTPQNEKLQKQLSSAGQKVRAAVHSINRVSSNDKLKEKWLITSQKLL
jgi:hypothetical protein